MPTTSWKTWENWDVAQIGHGRKIGNAEALPRVPVEKRGRFAAWHQCAGPGEMIAQEGRSRSPTLADRPSRERCWSPRPNPMSHPAPLGVNFSTRGPPRPVLMVFAASRVGVRT